jgi:tRNA (guanine-N7-)-methyltransferase
MTARAVANPYTAFVAIEWRKKWREDLLAKLARVGATNVEILTGDAAELVPRFDAASFNCAHIHFPDPWWKRRHLRRRLLDRHFVAEVARVLRPGGAVYVQTDVLDYAKVVLNSFEGSGLFQNVAGPLGFTNWRDEIPERSLREMRCGRDGTPFVQMKFVQREG